MKKILTMMLVACVAMLATACGNRLQEEIDNAQSALPINLGNGMIATQIYIDGNDVVMEYTMDEEMIAPIYLLKQEEAAFRQNFVPALAQSADNAEMFKIMKEENKNLRIDLKGLQSGELMSITVDSSEL